MLIMAQGLFCLLIFEFPTPYLQIERYFGTRLTLFLRGLILSQKNILCYNAISPRMTRLHLKIKFS